MQKTPDEIFSEKTSLPDLLEQPQRRRTVLNGVIRIALFFGFLGILIFAFDALVNHGLRKIKTSKYGAFNKVVNGQVNADLVINGSSRAWNHYDPRVIASATGLSAYNIGMNASQIDFQLAVLKTYLKHNKQPKLVIQNLDSFSFETTEKGKIYDPGYYIPYLEENEIYDFLRKIDPAAWKWKHIPLYGYAVEDMRFTWVWGVLGLFGVSGPEDYILGFNPRDQKWTGDFDQFKASNTNGVTYQLQPEGISALEEIIKTCQSNEIDIVLVYSPEYQEAHRLTTNREEIFASFRRIAARFQVPFWDFSDSSICKERDFFYNSQHLNRAGAESFSRELATQLKGLARNRIK